jgi:hypothetical protein
MMGPMTVSDLHPSHGEHTMTIKANEQRWIPACGQCETWTKARDGREYLYVWWINASDGVAAVHRHGWLDRQDVIHMSDPYNV